MLSSSLRRLLWFTVLSLSALLILKSLSNIGTLPLSLPPLPKQIPLLSDFETDADSSASSTGKTKPGNAMIPTPDRPPPQTGSAFAWSEIPIKNPVTPVQLPTKKHSKIPKIQHDKPALSPDLKKEWSQRKETIRQAFMHSWLGYEKHAWMRDEVAPLTGQSRNTFAGWGATLVDSLDTLWLMGYKDEFEKAIEAASKIDFTTSEEPMINVFETNIRYLGGFLGAYDISEGQYPALLEKAKEVGDMLYVAFDTPNRMPITRWDWQSAKSGARQRALEQTSAAELGSMTLEFTRLSQLTGDPKWYDAVQRVTDVFEEFQKKTTVPGLWPHTVDAKKPDMAMDTTYSLGGNADSLYEYFPKTYLLLEGAEDQYRKLYEDAIEAIKTKLLFRPMTTDNADVLFAGVSHATTSGVTLEPQIQHLSCFAGGMIGIASRVFNRPYELETARKLVDGCVWAHHQTPTGLMPESFHVVPCTDTITCNWEEQKYLDAVYSLNLELEKAAKSKEDKEEEAAQLAPTPPPDRVSYIDKQIKHFHLPKSFTTVSEKHYALRPEAIESLFILYRLTGNTTYPDAAWSIFKSIEKYAKGNIAYATVSDAMIPNPGQVDRMETFWMSETLKYLYLCFEEWEVLSLDEWVFSTEAHTFRKGIDHVKAGGKTSMPTEPGMESKVEPPVVGDEGVSLHDDVAADVDAHASLSLGQGSKGGMKVGEKTSKGGMELENF